MAYSDVQFVAFNIGPGTKYDSSSGKKKYLGSKVAADDIKVRCAVMKNAIKKAYEEVVAAESKATVLPKRGSTPSALNNVVDHKPPLKVFMAPEFYFRGADAGYPTEEISNIVPIMRQETDDPKYADWLFVFGTAIGYTPECEQVVRITYVNTDSNGFTEITVETLPHSGFMNATVKEFAHARVDHVEQLFGHLRLTLDRPTKFAKNMAVKMTGPPGSPLTCTIKEVDAHPDSGNSRIKIECAQGEPCPTAGCKCAKHVIVDNPVIGRRPRATNVDRPPVPEPASCSSCGHTHLPVDIGSSVDRDLTASFKPIKVTQVVASSPPGRYRLTLDTKNPFGIGNKARIEADPVEVVNVALVRRGGPDPSVLNGLREGYVYKEYVSPIDFIGPTAGDFAKFHASTGSGRVIEVQGVERTVKPTSGSRDLLSAQVNKPGDVRQWKDSSNVDHEQTISEINRLTVGGTAFVGGGSVFTMDEITFGLEVCLDHAKNRLGRFYDYYCPKCDPNGSKLSKTAGTCATPTCSAAPLVRHAKDTDPRVQIQLIPSWGMSIGGGWVCGVPNAPVFNVDGARSHYANGSVLRINDGKYGCDNHPMQVLDGPGPCADPEGDVVSCLCSGAKTHSIKVGWDNKSFVCPTCNSGLVRNKNDQLKAMGSGVAPLRSGVDVDMSPAGSDWKAYFLQKGHIALYPVRPIPPAQAVKAPARQLPSIPVVSDVV